MAMDTGDWIIHVNYGVGQVIDVEKKQLGGKSISYYRVEGQNGTFWLPVDKVDTDRVRPVVSKQTLKQAIDALSEKPQAIVKGHKYRQLHIKETRQKVSLQEDARLVRDLCNLDANKELSPTEQDALEDFKKRLAFEWAVVMDIEPKNARKKLEGILAKNQSIGA